jgi:hypothetical protein
LFSETVLAKRLQTHRSLFGGHIVRISSSLAAKTLAVSSLALLLGSSAFAAPQDRRDDRRDNRRDGRNEYRSDRISTQGRISDIRREGDRYRIMLDRGSYSYYVPVATVRDRNLRVGLDVRLGGFVAGDVVNVDLLAFRGDPNYAADPSYRAVPYGSNGWMAGVVQRVDRHLGFIAVRDDQSGQTVKIDVRHMNLRRPVNVWGIRAGEHITINGTWEKRDTFDARQIEY